VISDAKHRFGFHRLLMAEEYTLTALVRPDQSGWDRDAAAVVEGFSSSDLPFPLVFSSFFESDHLQISCLKKS
jgi:hypothetical protein